MLRTMRAAFAAAAFCALATAMPAEARFWQCAPFAREVSGIAIHGNAGTWWSQAAGKYERGHSPEIGSVLVFKPHGRMRIGHVAMVSRVVDARTVKLTHANWSRRGRVETDVEAVDVSEAGDWSKVKVWYASQQGLGLTSYPTFGFIYADEAKDAGTPQFVEAAPTAPTQPNTRMAEIGLTLASLQN